MPFTDASSTYGIVDAGYIEGVMRTSLLLIISIASAGVGVALTFAFGPSAIAISSGDWLQFAGAMVGVIFAIWGALAVEHWRQREADRRDERVLLSSMTALLQAMKGFGIIVEYGQDFEDFAPKAREAVSSLDDAKDMMSLVSSSIKIQDLKLWRDIRFVERKLEEHEILYDPNRDLIRSDIDLERIYNSFQIWSREISPAAKRIVSRLEKRRSFA